MICFQEQESYFIKTNIKTNIKPTTIARVAFCIPWSTMCAVARTTMSNVLWVISIVSIQGILEGRKDILTRSGKYR